MNGAAHAAHPEAGIRPGRFLDFPDQLPMFVPNEDCAAKIEANYSDDLAVAAEQVFSQPVRIVNVLPMDFSSHQN